MFGHAVTGMSRSVCFSNSPEPSLFVNEISSDIKFIIIYDISREKYTGSAGTEGDAGNSESNEALTRVIG